MFLHLFFEAKKISPFHVHCACLYTYIERTILSCGVCVCLNFLLKWFLNTVDRKLNSKVISLSPYLSIMRNHNVCIKRPAWLKSQSSQFIFRSKIQTKREKEDRFKDLSKHKSTNSLRAKQYDPKNFSRKLYTNINEPMDLSISVWL